MLRHEGHEPDGLASRITRRQILKGATALGLTAGILGPLLAACSRIADTPIVTPTISNTPIPTPFNTPIPPPTLPVPTATLFIAPTVAVPTPIPTATPTPVPQPTATPTPKPIPNQISIFEADTSNLTERQKVAHLLRRAGFGYGKPDLDRAESIGLKATINELVDFESIDDSALTKRIGDAGLDFELRNELRRWWIGTTR
jgi:hypothetical protein